MQADAMSIRDFLTKNDRTFAIPVYQRNYEWQEKHCQRLFRDIENIAKTDRDHFIGTIVFISSVVDSGWHEDTIVDGQQRITTIMLLLKAIYDYLQDQKIKNYIYDRYLTNELARDQEQKIKLKLIKKDAQVYEEIIEGLKSKKTSKLINNFELLKHLIMKSNYSPEKLFEATGRLMLVSIELKSGDENAQVIFECINSTGTPLSESDKIRNYLLMNCDSTKQIRLHRDWIAIEHHCNHDNKDNKYDYVTDFIKNYLIMKTCNSIVKEMEYEAFKDFVLDHYIDKEDELLAELRRYAEYYSWLRYCDSDHKEFKELNEKLKQFHAMKSTAAFCVLLWLIDKWHNSKLLTLKALLSAITTLLSYQFRRLICKYNTNALNSTYESVLKEFKKCETIDNYNTKLLQILSKKSATQAFPRNEDFRREFITFDVFPKLSKYTLRMLENYLNQKEKIDMTQQITIEHIMPQTLTKEWKEDLGLDSKRIHTEWLHTIGNLTLTGNNSGLGNLRFQDKRSRYYLSSNIALSRELAKAAREWNEKTIRKRAEKLADMALEIWPLPPKYDFELGSEEINYFKSYDILDNNINIVKELPSSYSFCGHEKPVESWREMFVDLLTNLYHHNDAIFKTFMLSQESKSRHLAEPLNTAYEFRKEPARICPDFLTELGFSSSDLMKFMVRAVGLYDDLEGQVLFTLKPKNHEA